MNPLGFVPHPSLSIIIPLFNEEENIPLLIRGILNELDADPNFLEIVLVNDGSSDKTVDVAKQFCAQDSRIRLISHDKNSGLGAAIRTGLRSAEGEWVLYTDADLPFDFKLIPKLLSMMQPENIVIGCRNNRGEGGRRWLLSKGYNLITWLVLGVRVRDVNFACKLFPRRAVRGMRLHSEGSFIDVEMLLECRRLGYEIAELPMTYFPRQLGQSTLSRPGVVWGIVLEMIGYLWRRSLHSWRGLSKEIDQQAEKAGESSLP